MRNADGLLLVQPYSPELFRLGDLPGPRLLMEALRGKVTPQQLKKEWRAVEKDKRSGQNRQGILRIDGAQVISSRRHTIVRELTYVFICSERKRGRVSSVSVLSPLSTTHLGAVAPGHACALPGVYEFRTL